MRLTSVQTSRRILAGIGLLGEWRPAGWYSRKVSPCERSQLAGCCWTRPFSQPTMANPVHMVLLMGDSRESEQLLWRAGQASLGSLRFCAHAVQGGQGGRFVRPLLEVHGRWHGQLSQGMGTPYGSFAIFHVLHLCDDEWCGKCHEGRGLATVKSALSWWRKRTD